MAAVVQLAGRTGWPLSEIREMDLQELLRWLAACKDAGER